MKKIIVVAILLLNFNVVFAQIVKERFIKIEGGATLDNNYRFSGEKEANSTTDNLFHLGANYSLNFYERLEIGLGPRIDYIGSTTSFTKDYVLASLLLQGQFNFNEKPKSFFLYSQYGMGPKLGSWTYSGSIFEIGLGWKYHPKFLGNKRLGFSMGYNVTHLNKVLGSPIVYGSEKAIDNQNRTTVYEYLTFKLRSITVNLNFSF